MQNDWALVVGINHYPKAGAVVRSLQGAVHDATAFHQWVISPTGGAVPAEHARLIVGPTTQETPASGLPEPLLPQVLSFFDWLREKLEGRVGRRLYIYLSGHGIAPTGQESGQHAALLMANARGPDAWHCFVGSVWAAGTRNAAHFRETVLIMDCCRDISQNATIIPYLHGQPVNDAKDCRLVEFYATGWSSKAREQPFPPDGQPCGVFTRALLAVLWSGRMTGAMLKASVTKHLEETLNGQSGMQQPEIRNDNDLPHIIFNEAADPPRSEIQIRRPATEAIVIKTVPVGGGRATRVPLDTWTHDGTAWNGTLEPGLYLLSHPTGDDESFPVVAGLKVSRS